MNSKERFIKALNHIETDRVPIDLGGHQTGIMINAYESLKKIIQKETNIIYEETEVLEPMQQLAVVDERLLEYLEIDTRYIFPKSERKLDIVEHNDGSRTYVRDFGNQTFIQKPNCPYYEFKDYPLAYAKTKADLLSFEYWPDTKNKERTKGLQEEIDILKNKSYGIVSVLGSGVMEQSWYLCGLERFMINTIDRPSFILALLDKILEIQIELFGNFLEITGKYLDCVEIFDDLAGQNGLLYSHDFIKNIILPRNRELINFIKSKTNAKVMWHSCGAIYDIIPDLIEIGVEILNPIQVSSANMRDTKKLKKEYGKELVFWGGIDTQHVLPYGSVRDVEEEVKLRISDMSSSGGYVLNSVHNIQDGTPPENIIAMFKTAKQYSLNKNN